MEDQRLVDFASLNMTLIKDSDERLGPAAGGQRRPDSASLISDIAPFINDSDRSLGISDRRSAASAGRPVPIDLTWIGEVTRINDSEQGSGWAHPRASLGKDGFASAVAPAAASRRHR